MKPHRRDDKMWKVLSVMAGVLFGLFFIYGGLHMIINASGDVMGYLFLGIGICGLVLGYVMFTGKYYVRRTKEEFLRGGVLQNCGACGRTYSLSPQSHHGIAGIKTSYGNVCPYCQGKGKKR